jgi:hypothetical protein
MSKILPPLLPPRPLSLGGGDSRGNQTFSRVMGQGLHNLSSSGGRTSLVPDGGVAVHEPPTRVSVVAGVELARARNRSGRGPAHPRPYARTHRGRAVNCPAASCRRPPAATFSGLLGNRIHPQLGHPQCGAPRGKPCGEVLHGEGATYNELPKAYNRADLFV